MTDIAMQAMYKEKMQIMDGASHFNTDSPPPFCATFAEVEVDTETGQVRVLHLATAVDPGTAINPMQAEGQVEGAVTQGLGYALTEELLLDDAGRPLNPNFLDYKIFSAKDMPKLTTILVETDEPLGPFGAKSISEVPINGPAPAIANAIFHAVGVRIRKLPIRPEDVLRALRDEEREDLEEGLVTQNEYPTIGAIDRRAPGGTGASLRSRHRALPARPDRHPGRERPGRPGDRAHPPGDGEGGVRRNPRRRAWATSWGASARARPSS